MQEYDLAVIGTGAAGSSIAYATRAAGWSVAIVDELPFGGTCQLRGCDPKKILVGAAEAVDWARRMAQVGVVDAVPRIVWHELMRYKRAYTDPLPEQRLQGYEQAGIVPLHGHARFVDANTLDVDGERLRAKKFAIASGAMPMKIAPGDEHLLTSTDFLELDELPARIVFVGGGFISFEFAHIAARAGAAVQILHRSAHPLANFDGEVVDRLVEHTRALGIEVVLEANVTRIERRNGRTAVYANVGGVEREFVGDAAVHGAGRVANIDALELDRIGVARTKRGVAVNEYLQSTTNPDVYAAGDCADAGGAPLTPVAGDEGETVAENLLHGNHKTMNFTGLASTVYTIPALATVGLTERRARERGLDVRIERGDMSNWYSARRVNEKAAYFKMLVEKVGGRIVGAHILGPHAEEQINVLALAMRMNATADDIRGALFGYPSGASDLQYML